MVDQPIVAEVPQLLVSDRLRAYQQTGHWWCAQFAIPVIGITGSVGKTTTKEMMAAALQTAGPTLNTEKTIKSQEPLRWDSGR